jgi:acylphosphatase
VTARERVRAPLRVTGLVQGVFFRQATAGEASRLGVGGAVRNLPDGSVEVVAEGPRAGVETLVAWCRRGPPSARVADVQVGWEAPTGAEGAFAVLR